MEKLLGVLSQPYQDPPEQAGYRLPPPPWAPPYRTSWGTWARQGMPCHLNNNSGCEIGKNMKKYTCSDCRQERYLAIESLFAFNLKEQLLQRF
jgi:hypothetical protein